MHRWPRREWGSKGWWISRGLLAVKAVPDTPLVTVRATPVRLSLRYSIYIPLKTLVHLGYLSIPTHSHPLRARQDGRAMHRVGAEGTNPRCTARAPRIFQYLFIIVPKVRPPLILVPPMLSNRSCSRGKVDTRVLFNIVYLYNACVAPAIV